MCNRAETCICIMKVRCTERAHTHTVVLHVSAARSMMDTNNMPAHVVGSDLHANVRNLLFLVDGACAQA